MTETMRQGCYFSPEVKEEAKEKRDPLENFSEEKKTQIREAVLLRNYDKTKDILEKEALLPEIIQEVRGRYGERIGAIRDFQMPEEGWEMFAILWAYDEPTAEHCIRTAEGAVEILFERIEDPFGKEIVFADLMKEEGVEAQEFLFACLLHDVGKVGIPQKILNNRVTPSGWDERFCEIVEGGEGEEARRLVLRRVGLDPAKQYSKKGAQDRLKGMHLWAKEVIPTEYAFPKDERENIRNILMNMGLDPNVSFLGLLDEHAKLSQEILSKYGHRIAAAVAGGHHNRNGTTSLYKFTLPSLHGGGRDREERKKFLEYSEAEASNLLKIVDITDACLDPTRPYKSQKSELWTLAEIVRMTEARKEINLFLTYGWIKTRLRNLTQEKLNLNEGLNPLWLISVQGFLKRYEEQVRKQWGHSQAGGELGEKQEEDSAELAPAMV